MTLTIQLFAKAKELVGSPTVLVDLSARPTVRDLRERLCAKHPEIAAVLAISAIAVNHEFADDMVAVTSRDEIAIIPPVSGG
jgi:molybdopterin converting factor subunit 1